MPSSFHYCHRTFPGCSCSEYSRSSICLHESLGGGILKKLYLQCSGSHRIILTILHRTLCDALIFCDNNLVIQDFRFRSRIILIKIIGCRNGESLVHMLFTMAGFLLFVIILIIRQSNGQFGGITLITLTTNSFFYWGDNSVQYSQLFERSIYFL